MSACDLIFIATIIALFLSITCFIGYLHTIALEDRIRRSWTVGLLISLFVMATSIIFMVTAWDLESARFLVGRNEVTSVSRKSENGKVLFVRDGKTFQIGDDKCRFIVVDEGQFSGYALPYYEQVQEVSIESVTIFGHKFYDEPQIETKYAFYVTEDFLENLDYEIEHIILIDD